MATTHLCYGDGRGPRICAEGPESECEPCAARARQWQHPPKDAKRIVEATLRTMPDVEPITADMDEGAVAAAVGRVIGRLAGFNFAVGVADGQAKIDAWRQTGVWPNTGAHDGP